MSAAALAVDAISAAQKALYEAERAMNDAATKLRTAKKARESTKSTTTPKKLLELRQAHELAEEVHAAAVREHAVIPRVEQYHRAQHRLAIVHHREMLDRIAERGARRNAAPHP